MSQQQQQEQQQEEHVLANAGFSTIAIHSAQEPEIWDSRCVTQPIILSTTFKQYGPVTDKPRYDYSRCDNPARKTLENALAALEKAKYGLCFSSGLAAVAVPCYLLNKGDHIILSDDCYGGTVRYYNILAVEKGIEVSNVDMCNMDNVKAALKPNTKMIWLETPSNPTLKILDLIALCELVRQANPNVIITVDNTFATPYFQNPLVLGADLVMHSVTKYLNGHADVIMGCLCTNNENLYKKLNFLQYSIGAVPSPFDCYLVLRGLKTLGIRMEQHQKNGIKIAEWLESNPRIEKIYYPLLKSHPEHEIFKKQMKGFGGMIGFYVKGDGQQTIEFIKALRLITTAVSLGSVESLITRPEALTHMDVPAALKKTLGILPNFVRFSVGIEDAEDLIADLDQALRKTIPEPVLVTEPSLDVDSAKNTESVAKVDSAENTESVAKVDSEKNTESVADATLGS